MAASRRFPWVWLAWAGVAVTFVLPVGSLVLRSFQVQQVVTTDGEVLQAVGEVQIGDEEVTFSIQAAPGEEKQPWSVERADLEEVRTVFSLDHYENVFGDDRTLGLLRNSAIIALGGALLALLLGVPMAWILVRARLPWPWILAGLGVLCLVALVLWWLADLPAWGLDYVLANGVLGGFLVLLFRLVRLPGRYLIAALCLGPAILPPFFIALGGARRMQDFLLQPAVVKVFDWFRAFVAWAFGWQMDPMQGGTLQIVNSILVFGCVLFPLYVLLVGRSLAAVPAGPYEAARLLRGPRSAARHVIVPAVLPAVVGAFVLTLLLALTDFAVPDVLGFMLPAGGSPSHVFATEVLLQWKQQGNTGRAVATAAPFIVLTAILLGLALVLLRRSPVFSAARGQRSLPRLTLSPVGTSIATIFVALLLGVSLYMPLQGIASWAGEGGESAAAGTAGGAGATANPEAALFDFSGTLDRTTGSREERNRWIATAVAAALLAMAMAAPLARAATRGGRLVRAAVLVIGMAPLAIPGLVMSVGTLLFWQSLPDFVDAQLQRAEVIQGFDDRSVCVLAARFLPFALLAAWLAFRRIRPGQEEAAAMLGAGAGTRAWRILLPATWVGVLSGGLVVFVLALRELDAVMLVDARVLPMRLYDKIHFNRMADEANLLFLCLAYLLVPAVVCALLVGLRSRRRR